MTPIPVDEWLKRGSTLFGNGATAELSNFMKWRFRCPICGNVATPAEFKALGADPNLAYQECIGRQMPRSEPKPKKPCDYAAYGLFNSGIAIQPNGSSRLVYVFPFDEEARQ